MINAYGPTKPRCMRRSVRRWRQAKVWADRLAGAGAASFVLDSGYALVPAGVIGDVCRWCRCGGSDMATRGV